MGWHPAITGAGRGGCVVYEGWRGFDRCLELRFKVIIAPRASNYRTDVGAGFARFPRGTLR
jgi:hypothetical protein